LKREKKESRYKKGDTHSAHIPFNLKSAGGHKSGNRVDVNKSAQQNTAKTDEINYFYGSTLKYAFTSRARSF